MRYTIDVLNVRREDRDPMRAVIFQQAPTPANPIFSGAWRIAHDRVANGEPVLPIPGMAPIAASYGWSGYTPEMLRNPGPGPGPAFAGTAQTTLVFTITAAPDRANDSD
ncbi:hypothetical protein U1872_11705 [Sphingomonas sp. RB3P16]|uniref:hypothetical protein n=1 Tax=Parasphingomonas frigoris TaxID=3096163 RepID=UPI002FCB583D